MADLVECDADQRWDNIQKDCGEIGPVQPGPDIMKRRNENSSNINLLHYSNLGKKYKCNALLFTKMAVKKTACMFNKRSGY